MNMTEDVKVVQYIVNRISASPLLPLVEDGVVTADLVTRIRQFQSGRLKFPKADGRVDPGGRTLRGLLDAAAKAPGASTAMPFGLGAAFGAPAYRSRADACISQAFMVEKVSQQTTKELAKSSGNRALTLADYEAAARAISPKVETAVVRAYAKVESGGKSGFGTDGLPVIAFEGHLFRRYTKKRYDETHPHLSYPFVTNAGPEWQKNNKDQATAWKTLKEADGLDHEAAVMSASWGMFQIMGFNHAAAGFTDVDAFVEAMKLGERQHLDAFLKFCLADRRLVKAMEDKDFKTMAEIYNGAEQKGYNVKIEKAYKELSATK